MDKDHSDTIFIVVFLHFRFFVVFPLFQEVCGLYTQDPKNVARQGGVAAHQVNPASSFGSRRWEEADRIGDRGFARSAHFRPDRAGPMTAGQDEPDRIGRPARRLSMEKPEC